MSERLDISGYCRDVEAYLCRKNGGHLVRVVGPAFELVRAWADVGVPIKVVFQGIDRYVQRQMEKPARQRPARIAFCERDVMDAFDAWRRAVGALAGTIPSVGTADTGEGDEQDGLQPSPHRRPSLPMHLQRVQTRLTSLLAGQRLPHELAETVDRVVRRLDGFHEAARGARGEKRESLLAELKSVDLDLVRRAWQTQQTATTSALRDEAAADLASFRHRMHAETWEATVEAAAHQLLRDRLGLPTISLE